MVKSPFVSIIIVQYNNSQDTIECLENVKKLNYPNFKIIVIDNASEVKHVNSTRFYIESAKDNRFLFITSKKNLGYSGGNNLGIKKSLAKKSDYFFILNPDTIVESDTLIKLVTAAESNSEIGVVGPVIKESTGKNVYGGRITWLRSELAHSEILPHNTGYLILDTSLYLPGAAILIKKDVIKKIGLLNERYFLYFEDADFCVRARQSGFKLALVPESVIAHTSSTSTSLLGASLLLRYHYRNAHLFNWKNGPLYIKFALPFWSFFIIIKQLVKIFLGRERVISRAILAGVVDFYKNRFNKIN